MLNQSRFLRVYSKLLNVATVAALLVTLVTFEGFGQPRPDFDVLIVTPEAMSVNELMDKDDLDGAKAVWLKIAREQAGLPLGANSLVWLLRSTDSKSEQIELLKRLVREYPGSRYELVGKGGLVARKYENDQPGYVRALDLLIQTYGGPSLQAVLQQSPSKLAKSVRQLSWEVQSGLVGAYLGLQNNYLFNKDYRKSFCLAHFCREAFPFTWESGNVNARLSLSYEFLKYGQQVTHSSARKDPIIQVLSPSRSSQKGPRPKFSFQANAGLWPDRIDLADFKCKLDGVDVRKSLVVKSDLDEKLTGTRPFEYLTFTYRPAQKLARGRHVLEVEVPIVGYNPHYGGGLTKFQIPVNVGNDRDDSEDEREDDD